MPAYQLQIKQVVDYPRCRIYRQFVHRLMADRSIRTSGGSGLFYFTVLCSYANFRTSYRRIDGIISTRGGRARLTASRRLNLLLPKASTSPMDGISA